MSDWDFLNGDSPRTSSNSSSTINNNLNSGSRNSSRDSGLSQLVDVYDDTLKNNMSTFTKNNNKGSQNNSPAGEKSKYLVHQLAPKDTLQGLAIKYNVKVNDIKRINNMWTQDSLFIKKTILIPIEVSDLVTSETNSNSSGSGSNSLNSSSSNIKNILDGNYGVGGNNSNGNGSYSSNTNGNNNGGASFDNVFPEFEKMNKTFSSKERPILPPSTFNGMNSNIGSGTNRPHSTLSFSPVVNSLDQKTQTQFSLLDEEWNPL